MYPDCNNQKKVELKDLKKKDEKKLQATYEILTFKHTKKQWHQYKKKGLFVCLSIYLSVSLYV